MVEIDPNKVWKKGNLTSDPNKWRKDHYAAWIKYDDYGKIKTYGWQVDHIMGLLEHNNYLQAKSSISN